MDEEEDEGEENDDKLESSDADDGLEVDKDETAEDIEVIKDVLPSLASKSDDREKGKAVMYQLGVWDDLIKSRIALQKMVTSCNRLPLPDTWTDFAQNESFRKEAKNVHSSVRKLVSTLLDLQLQLLQTEDKSGKSKSQSADSDEEITSESEDELDQKQGSTDNSQLNRSQMDKGEKDDEDAENGEDMETDAVVENKHHGRLKRKLGVEEVEETIMKRHTEFQSFRNDTLSKWDEKTRLTRSKVKAKNFAAFEVSVLKQIEQVLVNRERLVKRLHQQRSAYTILGQRSSEIDGKTGQDGVVDDDDDEVEIKLEQRSRQEAKVNQEIIDDNDFYHVCLRDLIELKQNEETDPVMANKQWLEIQRLRNKQKRKVDTRASKGRKIRYHVKEKLKNYMTPYDKSLWSDEQKDDLFKALFGGRRYQENNSVSSEKPLINLGI
uniref:Protein AATF n=1 Tax=Arion vulgaris TaxID=1028688 RepID=A0A0B7BJ04_9EUPU